jgi:predicted dehydrogenase
MLFFYNDETPAEWVMGQIDLRGVHKVFGVQIEGQGLSLFQYRNGVQGMLITHADAPGPWRATNRLIGSDGTFEVCLGDGPPLRMWGKGQSGWQEVEVPDKESSDLAEPIQLGILDLIESLKAGREPELSGRKALQATELIFGTYESSRRRGRVDLPLEIDDSPLMAMLGHD